MCHVQYINIASYVCRYQQEGTEWDKLVCLFYPYLSMFTPANLVYPYSLLFTNHITMFILVLPMLVILVIYYIFPLPMVTLVAYHIYPCLPLSTYYVYQDT